MARGHLRQSLTLTTASILGAVLAASPAFSHPAVPLKDISANPILLNCSDNVTLGGKTYCEGNPVSWETTCGACHSKVTGDVTGGVHSPGPIDASYHVGRGWDEMSDEFGAERVKKGEDYRKFLRSLGDDGAW